MFDWEETDSEAKTERQLEAEKRKRDREQSDLKKILATPEGRRFVWGLLEQAGVFRSSFTGNSQTFFLEGRRDLGLQLLAKVFAAKPEAFAQMQREVASERKSMGKEGLARND